MKTQFRLNEFTSQYCQWGQRLEISPWPFFLSFFFSLPNIHMRNFPLEPNFSFIKVSLKKKKSMLKWQLCIITSVTALNLNSNFNAINAVKDWSQQRVHWFFFFYNFSVADQLIFGAVIGSLDKELWL